MAAHGALWVSWLEAGGDGVLRGTVERRDALDLTRTARLTTTPYAQMAAGPRAVWLAAGARVAVVDPVTTRVRHTVRLPSDGQATGIAVTRGAAVVATGGDERMIPLHTATGRPGRWARPSGRAPIAVAASPGAVWEAVPGARRRDGTRARGWLLRLEPGSLRITGRARVGRWPSALAVGGGVVWVVDSADGTITRVDPRSLRVGRPVPVAEPGRVVPTVRADVGHGRLWVVGTEPGRIVTLRTDTAVADVGRLGRMPIADVAVGPAGAQILVASPPRSRICRLTEPPHIRVLRCVSLGR